MVYTRKVSTRGRVTIPVELLREWGVQPGDRLAVSMKNGRLYIKPAPKNPRE